MSFLYMTSRRGLAILLEGKDDVLGLYADAIALDFELEILITAYNDKIAELKARGITRADLRTSLIALRSQHVQNLQNLQAMPGAPVSYLRRTDTILTRASLFVDGARAVSDVARVGKVMGDSLI